MEKTNEIDLTKFREYLFDELKRIECKCIDIITLPDGTLEYPIKSNRDPAIQLHFTKDGNRYFVVLTKYIDGECYYRLNMKVELTRTFNDSEMIPLSALNVQDTLTVIKQTEEGTLMRLTHKVYDSFACKKPCDTNVITELVAHILEISKL